MGWEDMPREIGQHAPQWNHLIYNYYLISEFRRIHYRVPALNVVLFRASSSGSGLF